ncbi:MAG TPA: CehA/McbA family metallohydrolase [Anaerolineaceae bacterium]|nr:CehA/McbA family metallohydrolase [Anaerolineaceae bacterium]
MNEMNLHRHITPTEQGLYLLLPFEMPDNTAQLNLSYAYQTNTSELIGGTGGEFSGTRRANIVDIGLIAPDGMQVGASGSSRSEIMVSEVSATPGYQPHPLTPGSWQIILGAYVIAPEGVDVSVTLEFTPKVPGWLCGDLHVHTLASDGSLPLDHLAEHARIHGLDFIAITDHNQPVKRASFPKVEGLTIISGQEWTHYKGHSNFLGLEQPYQGSFIANSQEEAQKIFHEAHQNGALISINHPYEANFGFCYDLDLLDYDLIEIWNGPMRPTNLEAIARWDGMLKAGRKQVATCGSDYHEDTFFQRLASPCIYVLADSASESDILAAVKAGRSYFTFSPTKLQLLLDVDGQTYGSSLDWREGMQASLKGVALEKGDVIRLVTREGSQDILTAPERGDFKTLLPVTAPGYWRLEIWRTFFSFLPPMPALVTNPIWFDQTN